MPATEAPGSLESAMRGFRELALRRHAHYLELLQSGRWRHYFNEQQFAERLRDVMVATRAWNSLVETAGPDAGAGQEPPRETRSAA